MSFIINKDLIMNKINDELWHIYNPQTMKHYEIGKNEYNLLNLLNKKCSLEDLSSKTKIPATELTKILSQLLNIQLIYSTDTPKRKKKINKLTRFYLLRFNTSKFKKNLFTQTYQLCLFICCLASLISVVCAFRHLSLINIIKYDASIKALPILFLVTIITLIFHEISHGIIAINQGAMVPEMGLLVYLFMPTGYADVTGINFTNNKNKKLLVLIGGLMVNFCMVGLSSFLWINNVKNRLIASIFLSNLCVIIFNLSFFIKLDGYYILELILNEEYLFEKSISSVSNKKENNAFYPKDNAILYKVFGTFSLIFIPLIVGNVILSFL